MIKLVSWKFRRSRPTVDSGTLLAGAQFVDTYRVVLDGARLVNHRPPIGCMRGNPDGSKHC